MGDKTKHLVRAGHEFAAAMSDDTPIITIAKMVTELASALDVQTARSDALAAELKQSKIDAGCYKHGMEQSNKRLVDIAAENAALKSGGRELLGEACAVYAKLNKLIDPEIDDFIDGQTLHEFQFLLDTGTPATDAWVNEQRDAILAATFEAAKQEVERRFGRTFQDCAWLARRSSDTQMKGAVEMAEWVELYAAQLRGSQV